MTSRIHPSHWLQAAGEMGKVVAAKDWSQTSLGSIDSWPQSLRTTVSLCLSSNFPISIAWGPEGTQIYNDGYWPICGAKHPHSMGQDFKECWFSAWPVIGAAFESAAAGQAAFLTNQRLFIDRNGYLEETFFTFSFSPIHDESGAVVGLFHPVTELTQESLAERRLQVLRDVADQTAAAQNIDEVLSILVQTLAKHVLDVPFTLFYRLVDETQQAILAEVVGLERNSECAPELVNLTASTLSAWPLMEAIQTRKSVQINDLTARFKTFCCEPYPEPPKSGLVLPLFIKDQNSPYALMVVGVSSRRPLDDAYTNFYEMLAESVSTALMKAHSYEQERKRAEALAELDRSKTVFFSNVSHEFRTPLTLMLGPLEELKARFSPEGLAPAAAEYDQLSLVHRNSLRLLKLVNSLLDFSRIEAGRMEAAYEATDLAAFTAELASSFRSAIDKAGLKFIVSCPTLPEPVYVDRQMWEKIVLNLLSNAFKHTFEGEIEVALRWCGKQVVLTVRDTGAGIAKDHLEHIFDRFHRVQNVRSRSHEGTGIGLALVQELARMHGGEVSVTSEPGVGSIFTVVILTGIAHIQPEHIHASQAPVTRMIGADFFAEEAIRWELGSEHANDTGNRNVTDNTQALSASTGARILLADDNADMRGYVARLLEEQGYSVTAVPDGEAALVAVRENRPDLVLSDIMMPRLDGIGLLAALRVNQETSTIPIILLSARAGEEARVEGLKHGADDYLTKPFSARELLARVGACIEISRLRNQAETQLRIQENEREFRATFDLAAVGIAQVSPEGRLVRVNQKLCDIVGYSHEELATKTFQDITHPEDLDTDLGYLQQMLTGQINTYSREKRYLRKDGSLVWINLTTALVRGDNGQPKYFISVVEDITGRKQLEMERQKFFLLAESSSEFIGMCDLDLNPLYVNPEGRRMVGLPDMAAACRVKVQDYFFPEDQRFIVEEFFPSVQRKGHGDVEIRLRHFQTGEPIWMFYYLFCVYDATGMPVGWATVSRNITERRQAESALRESEARLRSVTDNVSIGIVTLDSNRLYRFVNPAYIRILGLSQSADELIGRSPAEVLASIYTTQISPRLDRAFAGEKVTYEMMQPLASETEPRHYTVIYEPIRDGEEIDGVIVIIYDITQLKQTEDALRQSEREFRVLTEAMPQIVWVTLPDGWNIYHNQRWAEYTGLTLEESYGHNWINAVHPEDRQHAWEAWQRATKQHETYSVECRLRRADGVHRWWLIRGVPLLNDQGEIQKWYGTNTDIHDLKHSEEELKVAEARWQFALEGGNQGVWDWDLTTNQVFFSKQWCVMLGIERNMLSYRYEECMDRVHPDDLPMVMADLQKHKQGETPYFESEHRLLHQNGEYIWTHSRGMVVSRDAEGKPLRMIGTQTDISGQRTLLEELKQHRDHLETLVAQRTAELELANRSKSAFLANMSHEIRTPMNAILGLAYLLEQTALPGDANELVRKIRLAGNSLLGIINDILDFSKIESGKLELERASFNLVDVLDNLATIMSGNTGEKEIELIIAPPPGKTSQLFGDALRLEQVLINLTGNAIKFTNHGHVELSVEVVEDSQKQITLKFTVSDTGIGITPEQQQQIFAPFSQADGSTSRRFGGTGLGLTISRRLVEAMGGELKLVSIPGIGSAFSFDLCFEKGQKAWIASPEMSNINVLIAEDNPIARGVLAGIVNGLGWRANTVSSGEATIQHVLERQALRGTAEVLLLDYKMTGIDGLETAKAIRDHLKDDDLIIIMVTAHSSHQLQAHPDRHLADAVLSKPVTPSSLYNAVARAKRIRQGVQEHLPDQKQQRLTGLRILVVDDSDINREVAQGILAGEGAHVFLADDGRQAVDWLKANPAGVDLVLMDVQMPVLNGYEATQEIRNNPALSKLPVIALTAGVFSEQSELAHAAGMNGFIAKPFDVDAAIEQIIKTTSQVTLANTTDNNNQNISTDLPGLAISKGLNYFGSDPSAYKKFLRKFARDSADIVNVIEKSQTSEAAALAHKLKGNAGYLGLLQVVAQAGELEQTLKAGAVPSEPLKQLQIALDIALASIKIYAPPESDTDNI